MKTLIVYGTTEGQTRKICRFIADVLYDHGHMVELLPAALTQDLDLGRFERVILAGSVHAGQLQKDLHGFATEQAAVLNGLPTLYLQVSLAAAGDDPEEWRDLDRIAERFCSETGWKPGQVQQVAGAFRFSEYDFFKTWAMRWIAHQKGQKVVPGEDKEYTDWDALTKTVTEWMAG